MNIFQKIAHFINKIIWFKSNYQYSPRTWTPLSQNLINVFNNAGDGLYLINIKHSKSLISRIIGYFSNEISHTVLCLYSQNIMQYLNESNYKTKLKIIFSWNWYYGYSKSLEDYDINNIVLASATQSGMLCHDLSQYEKRKISIYRITSDKTKIINLLNFIAEKLDSPYDTTGLLLFLIKHGDDPNAYFCSEIVHDACAHIGIKISENENPSPGEIEIYLNKYGTKIYSDI